VGWTSEESWFDIWQGWEIFLFCKASRPAQAFHPPIQWVPAFFVWGVGGGP